MKDNNKGSDRIRVQFDMSEESIKKLDDLITRTPATSRAGVFRLALGFFESILDLIEQDGEIYFVDKNGDKSKLIFSNLKY